MKFKDGELYQITAPHFCACIIVLNNKIIDAAPILVWSIGKYFTWFETYCYKKRWKIYSY